MVFDSSLDQDARLLSVIRRLIQETGLKYLKSYLLAFLLSAIVAGTTVAVLFIVKDVIDEVFVNKNIAALYALAGAVCVIFVARGFAMFGQAVLLTQIRNAIILELKVRLFKKLMSREPSYVLSRTTGELLTMVSNSSSAASGLLHTLSDAIARDLFTLVALLIALLIQDFTLAMTLLLGAPIVALIVTTISKRLRNLSRRQLETNAIVNNRIRAGIQGIRVVKSFNMEREINEAMRRNAEHLTKLKDKHAVISNRFAPFMEMFGGVAMALAIGVGGSRIIEAGQTPGELVAFLLAALAAYDPARRLGKARVSIEQQLVGVRVMYNFLDAEEPQVDKPGAKPIEIDRGEIRFDEVRFGYVEGEPALNGLNLTAPAGKTTAIVGRSGAGKTTVANLLLRFWQVDAGAVTVDGQNVDAVTVDSLRANIAYVGQDAFLFDGTIRDNLLVGKPDATEEELRAAAEAAGALDFIDQAPRGLDTEVGELGANLSGGQRQRVAIARALLRDAPIVLLDEPTSALDAQTERGIQASLRRLAAGRTTIIIAHRLSTIRDADQIVVMEGGQAAEAGTHAELLALNGLYARLHRESSGPGSESAAASVEEPV